MPTLAQANLSGGRRLNDESDPSLDRYLQSYDVTTDSSTFCPILMSSVSKCSQRRDRL